MIESATFYYRFFMSVSVGFVITVLGAALLLLTAIWFSRQRELFVGERPAFVIRALSSVGFVMFFAGIAWQLAGYMRYVR
jgi:hypothetical protein